MMKYEIATPDYVRFAMTEKMDSRFRGNDIKNWENDIVGVGRTRGKHFTPTLVLPPQGGGDIRIEIAMRERK